MAKPLRVAHVVGKMVGGGMEAVVMNYYRHIDRDRVQFDLIVDSDSTIVPAYEVEALGGRIIDVPPYQKQPDNSKELERLFEREGWRIVHSHMNSLSVFPLRAAKRAGVPVRIAHSHSTWGKGEWKRNVIKAVLRTQSNRYPTHRLACTRHAGEWLFGKHADFQVLPNGIDLRNFRFDDAARKRIREGLSLPANAFVFGSAGRLTPQKNQSFLVNCYAKAFGADSNAYLLLIGEGADREALERQIEALGLRSRIFMLGQRDDMPALYSALDAFCLPSTYEGLGIVAVEAQSCMLPTLLSDKVPDDAVVSRGTRVLSLEEHSWSNALRECVAEGPRRVLPNEFALSRFDICVEAPRLVSWYEAALSASGV